MKTIEPHWEGLYRWFIVGITARDRKSLLKRSSEWQKLIDMGKMAGWDKKYRPTTR